MGAVYSVNFVNNSPNAGAACLYQTGPSNAPNALPLAWFAKMTAPTTRTKFQWTIDYSFVWAETGSLVPGVIFDAAQIVPADPQTSNRITLTRAGGGYYQFVNQQPAPPAGTFSIQQDSNIPANMASVGIGMSGNPIAAVNAQPNLVVAFTPGQPQYWIAFGNYIRGEVLDPQQIFNAARISFPANVYSMTAILNPDNTWTIQPTANVNAAFAASAARIPIAASSSSAPAAAGNEGGHPAPAERPRWGEVR